MSNIVAIHLAIKFYIIFTLKTSVFLNKQSLTSKLLNKSFNLTLKSINMINNRVFSNDQHLTFLLTFYYKTINMGVTIIKFSTVCRCYFEETWSHAEWGLLTILLTIRHTCHWQTHLGSNTDGILFLHTHMWTSEIYSLKCFTTSYLFYYFHFVYSIVLHILLSLNWN